MESTKEVKIDTNLYSRQIGTFGLATMGKLIKMDVLIVGLRGLGVETAKNLILAGPRSVTLYDPTTVSIADLGSNFYLDESHVGKASRAAASVTQLKELNDYVKVSVVDTLSVEDHKNYCVVVYTEKFNDGKHMIEVNEFCRGNKIGMICSETMGAVGYVFVDYTPHHIVLDHDGEQCKQFIISSISKAEKGEVTVHEDKRHSFQDGDYVKFVEVEGMTELNGHAPIKIGNCKPYSFELELDTREFGDYIRQGVVEDVKVPRPMPFDSLKESTHNPVKNTQYGMLETPDLRCFGRSDQLHIAIRACHAFHTQNGRYSDGEDDAQKVLEMAKQINAESKESEGHFVEELDEKVVLNSARYAGCSICPQAAFFGGIVAQEVVKWTGKYTPMRQWLHYDIFESLPEQANRQPMGCRYDDQIKMYGREVQEKLGKVNTFMVGAGALGCEYVKQFAMMGLGCAEGGKVSVTDNDNIEVSNLNRQFLFRKNNVGHSKSETACSIAKSMNPGLNVDVYTTLVAPNTESVFNDKFWESLDFIVNAVDNIKARLYVDSRCVWYEKPLLESGTLGCKANSQMIVPHKTQCYGDSQDPPEESIPMCTLRNFPNQIEHCIEWGRDKFNSIFVDRAQDTISFLENEQKFLAQLKQSTTSAGTLTAVREIKNMIDMKKAASFDNCVKVAKDYFNKFYDYDIQDLKSVFPDDHLDSHGQPFWSGPKRAPHPIKFDAKDEVILQFIMAAANLIAFNLGIEQCRDAAKVAEIANAVTAEVYVPKTIKVETPEEAKEREAAGQPAPKNEDPLCPDDEENLSKLMSELSIEIKSLKTEGFQAAEFEKDDDTNFHIDFIHACAGLRARNYKIAECDMGKTKMIAGKIIPAIATATAMITGSVGVELYKYVQGITDLEKFKNAFINLSLPLFLFSEPDEVKKNKSKEYDPIMCGPIKCLPEDYTIYDKVTVPGPLTFQGFFDYMKEHHKVEISMVACGKIALYNAYLPGNKHAARLPREMSEVYREISEEEYPKGRYYLVLEVGGETLDDGADFQMPPIKYCFSAPE